MSNIKKTILTMAAAACLWAGLAAGAAATTPPASLDAQPGDYNGTVNLSWIAPDALNSGSGDAFYIQYSLIDHSLDNSWAIGDAQIAITTDTANNELQSVRISGLEYGRTAGAPLQKYYFHVWIQQNGFLSDPVPSVNSYPRTPPTPSTSTIALADAQLRTVNAGASGGNGSRIAIDNAGNTYMLASLMLDTVTTGGTASASAITLLKFGPAGNILWYRAYNSTGPYSGSYWTNDQATALDLDQYGGIVIAGQIDNGASSMFKRFNSAGGIVWEARLNTDKSKPSRINAIADYSGTLYAAGEKYDATGSLWLAKFDLLSGIHQGVDAFYPNTQTGSYTPSGIAISTNSYIYVVGTKNVGYNNDIFVERFNAAWPPVKTASASAGGPMYDEGRGIKIDMYNTGNVYVTGAIYSSATYNSSCWTAKYNASLVPQWQDSYASGTNSAFGAALELDQIGNAYVTGREYRNDIYQGTNLLLMKYSSGGARLLNRSVDNGGYEEGSDVKVSSLGVIYAAGSFMNNPGVYRLDLSAASSILYVDKGPYTGSVNYSWVYQANMDHGASGYVQYSTSPLFNWSIATSTSIGSYGSPYTADSRVEGGFDAARDQFNNIISPSYYFKVWYSTSSGAGSIIYSPTNLPLAQPYVPEVMGETIVDGANGNLLKRQDGMSVQAGFRSVAMARDGAGNIYSAVRAYNDVPLPRDNGLALRKYDAFGNILWTRFYQSQAAVSYFPAAMTADNAGNIYIAGTKYFGSSGNWSIWTVKISPSGARLWEKTFDGPFANGTDQGLGVAADNSGNVYVAGSVLKTGPDSDAVILKYNQAAGVLLASATFNGTDSGFDNARALALDASGNVYMAADSQVAAPSLHYEMVFAKYSPGLNLLWESPYHYFNISNPSYRDNIPNGIAVSTSGFVYAGGVVPGTPKDAWFGKLNAATGVMVSTNVYSDYPDQEVLAVSISTSGEVYAVGQDNGAAWFQALDQDVNFRWSKKYSSVNNYSAITPYGVVIDNRGDFCLDVVLASSVTSSQAGYFKFSPPTMGLSAGSGPLPGTAELTWITSVALSTSTTYYVQASTWPAPANLAAAQRYNSSQAYPEGSLVRLTAGNLSAGRNADGTATPPYYFRAWYAAAAGSTVPVLGSAPAVPNLPALAETSYPYPLGQLTLLTGITNPMQVKMARDAAGNIYLATRQSVFLPSYSSSVMLRKYASSGAQLWTRYYNSGLGNDVYGLTTDAAGSIYLAGTQGGASAGAVMAYPYVAKYSGTGDLLWSKGLVSQSLTYDMFNGVTAGPDGNVYLAGTVNSYPSSALLAKYSQDGVLLASVTYIGANFSARAAGITYSAFNNQLYLAGQASINTSTTCFWVGRFGTDLVSAGADKKYCPPGANGYAAANAVKSDAAGYVYAAGSYYDQTESDNMLLVKLDPAMVEVWTSTYNSPGNSYDAIRALALDVNGGVYVAGSENRNDLNQNNNLFFRKYNAGSGEIVWTNTFNSSGNSSEEANDIAVDAAGYVYLPGMYSYGTNYQYAAGYFKYKQFSTSATNPMVTVQVKYNGGAAPLKDVNVYLLAFNQTGGMDPAGIRVSATDVNGNFSARVPGGLKYFVGLSTPGYIPTVKDQLMDPSGNFYLTLASDATRQFSLYPRAAADPVYTLTVNVSEGLMAGDFLMGEVSVNKTGEKVAYGVLASSAPAGRLQIFNVPPAPAGTYGVALSVPGKSKFLNFFLDTAFPAVSAYTVNMASAIFSSGGFDTTGSTVPPSFQGVVRSSPTMTPLEGARVELSITQCSGSAGGTATAGGCSTVLSFENLTDVNGQFSFYNIPSSSTWYSVNVKKLGSRSAFDAIQVSSMAAAAGTAGAVAQYREYVLEPATYTLTGLLKYNGIPVPNARVMAYGDWNTYSNGTDSYSRDWNGAMRSDGQVRTGADGIFTVPGLPDGRVRMNMDFMGTWRDLNAGPDGMNGNSDDIRIIISSDTATGPSFPGGNPCRPGTNWLLQNDSSGTCQSAGLITFNITPTSGNTAGTLSGTVVFVTTYPVSAEMPLVVPAESPVTIMATQDCKDGDCQNRQMGFTSIFGTFTTSSTTYSVTLSSGFSYYASVMSNEWGKMSNFNDQVNLNSTSTVAMDFTLTRSGGLKGAVKMPDGTSFRPTSGMNDDDPNAASANIEVRGVDVQYNSGTGLDDFGNFEFPNLPPGLYDVYLQPKGGAFLWPPVEVDDVRVTLGNMTEVKVKLTAGLMVQPQIFGLPELSTATWQYEVLGVPSGFQMNQKNVTEMFFEQPKYSFLYSTATATWEKKFMEPGQYDFYLVLGSKYECGKGTGASCDQFANFIGRVRNTAIQKSDSNPNLGTLNQPIPVNILGSVGQAEMSGRVKGTKIFTAGDFEKVFANFDNEIMGVIPAVMLYDNSGDLRAFTNAMPDEDGIITFESGIKNRSTTTVLASLAANPLRYLVWGMPPGRYTAVYASPNYPPVSVDVTLPRSAAEEAALFDFDAQDSVVGGIYGVILTSGTSLPVPNALVHLKHRVVEKFSVTDSSGAYRFDNLPTGIYRLEVARDGFVTAGRKTSLAGNDHNRFDFSLQPSESRITGKIYLSKFPAPSTRAGVRVVAYDETLNVEMPSGYLPKLEVQTDDSGAYEIRGIIPGHKYKLSAMFSGKMPEVVDVPEAVDGITVLDDVVLRDVPPQVTVKVRRNTDSLSKVDVEIRSPRELLSTPVCKYNPGEVYEAATPDDKVCASSSAVSLALVPGPNNTYLGQFTVSQNRPAYSVCVSAGDNNKMKKVVVYEQASDAKTEQYIQEEALAGGEINMDREKEEYSGMELDAGTLSYSTATTEAVNYQDLVGGFFSALPSVRTVKTAKGNLNLETALKDLMASEVYNMDLSNAQANKPFTLTLKYDKEKVTRTGNLRIYQYDADSGQWKEVPGNYTVDPMTGVVSVDVRSLDGAYRGTDGANTPLERKQFHMSAVRNGRYVPSSTTSSSQSGKFAVFTAKPGTGTAAFSSSFEVYNMPNPFSLKVKNVVLSSDAGSSGIANPYPTSGTLIKYSLPAGKSGDLKFVIYNLAGEKVRTIDEGARAGGQVYYSEWDGRNDNGSKCASGVYFMLAFQDGKKLGSKAHKMAIIK